MADCHRATGQSGGVPSSSYPGKTYLWKWLQRCWSTRCATSAASWLAPSTLSFSQGPVLPRLLVCLLVLFLCATIGLQGSERSETNFYINLIFSDDKCPLFTCLGGGVAERGQCHLFLLFFLERASLRVIMSLDLHVYSNLNFFGYISSPPLKRYATIFFGGVGDPFFGPTNTNHTKNYQKKNTFGVLFSLPLQNALQCTTVKYDPWWPRMTDKFWSEVNET